MYIPNVYRNALQCIYPMYIGMHYNVYTQCIYECTIMYIPNVYRNALQCIYPMYIGMHYNVYTFLGKTVTQCIYICHPMYIQYTLGIYIGLHPYIHWVARHIHWVAFFVTQCISKNAL